MTTDQYKLHCLQCGALQLKADAHFCHQCGAQIRTPPTEAAPLSPSPRPRRPKRWPMILIPILRVLTLVLIGLQQPGPRSWFESAIGAFLRTPRPTTTATPTRTPRPTFTPTPSPDTRYSPTPTIKSASGPVLGKIIPEGEVSVSAVAGGRSLAAKPRVYAVDLPAAPPEGFRLTGKVYDIVLDAPPPGPMAVKLPLPAGVNPRRAVIGHYHDGAWLYSGVLASGDKLVTLATSLSSFAVFQVQDSVITLGPSPTPFSLPPKDRKSVV